MLGFLETKGTPRPPEGWHKVRTASGQDAGFGMRCSRCGLEVIGFAPARIFHCGAWDERPEEQRFLGRLLNPLKTFTLPYGRERALDRAIIF